MRAASSMAAMGTATPIPIFDPVFNPLELADDELVLVGDVLGRVGTCAELASACAEAVEVGECIAEVLVVEEVEEVIELAIGMGL